MRNTFLTKKKVEKYAEVIVSLVYYLLNIDFGLCGFILIINF